MQFVLEFFKKVAIAKINNQDISLDWYKKNFLNDNTNPDELAINAGINKKTITNMYNSGNKEIVIDAANEHYNSLLESIKSLLDNEPEIDLKLTIKLNGVSVDLTINESLLVINTIAVKRASLRGGYWSTAGKSVEKYLMITLCKLFNVPNENYSQVNNPQSMREIDFYLKNGDKNYRCEVKLMGKGNPEGADAIFARESNVFIADKLSDLNKKQAEKLNVFWVELRNKNGFKKFAEVLDKLNIPYKMPNNIDEKLSIIFSEIFN